MSSEPSHLAAVLFDQIVDLAPADRERFLARHCPDEQTRGELKSLLAAHESAADFFCEPSGRPLDREPDRTGTIIGPYELLELLGEGGFARVYRARQTRPVRRDVALKLIKLGMDTRAVIARFELERQALAMMDHPGIAAVYDAGATEAGRPYFVMELVRGPRITHYCDERQLSVRQRIGLFIDVCLAVQHAHTKGILHRDLKPSNVLIATVDDLPVPKVIDFGIAKAVQQRLTDETIVTQAAQMLGTPQYMSPEQALSGGTDVDTRADIYSLGAMLYELLAGAAPLDASSAGASTGASSALQQLQRLTSDEELPPPSACAADPQRRRQLRGELDWIVSKCLERDRGRRYESAAMLAEDLRAYLDDRPIRAAPPTLAYRARKFARRNTAVVLLVLLAVFILLGGSIVSLTQAFRATRAERLAQQRLTDAESANATLRAVNDFLTNDMIGSADPAVARTTELSVRDALDRAAGAVATRFPDQPLIEAAVRYSIAVAYRTLGHPDRALPHAQHVRDVRRRILGEAHPDTIVAAHACALALTAMGRDAEAERIAGEALDVARRALGGDHPHTFALLDIRTTAVLAQGRWAEAEPLARQTWERSRDVLGIEHDKTLTWRNNYGRVLQMLGRLREAEGIFKDVWERRTRLVGEDHPSALTPLNNYALVLKQQGRLTDAEPLYQRALALRRRVFGNDHPDTLASLHNYAALLAAMQRFDEAQPLVEETLARRRRTQGDDHPHTMLAMSACAENFRALGRIDEALALHAEALERRRRTLGDDHPDTLVSMNNYALTLQSAGRSAEAEPLHREVMDVRLRLLGEDHRHTLGSLNNLARVLSELDRHADAEPLARRALDGYRRAFGDDHPETLSILSNYALLLEAMDRHADAEPLWAELARRAASLADGQRLSPAVAARFVSFHGPCLARLGRVSDAEPALLEARRRLIETNQTGHPRMPEVLGSLATLYERTNRAADAEAVRREIESLSPRPASTTTPPASSTTQSTRPTASR